MDLCKMNDICVKVSISKAMCGIYMFTDKYPIGIVGCYKQSISFFCIWANISHPRDLIDIHNLSGTLESSPQCFGLCILAFGPYTCMTSGHYDHVFLDDFEHRL